MEHQMSLFPSTDARKGTDAIFTEDMSALDEMFAASHRFRSSSEYLELLYFISRFPKYSTFNCVLLYTQNSSVSYVATAGSWKRQFNRHLKHNARPLVILAPMSPIRFVYDLADTEGDAIPPNLITPHDEHVKLSQQVFDHTVHNCAVHGIIVREVRLNDHATKAPIPITGESLQQYGSLEIDSQKDYLILLNSALCLEDRYACLVHELGQIFCGHQGRSQHAWWQDRQHESETVKDIESESVGFLVCRRKGLHSSAETYLSQYRHQERQIPIVGINTILTATSYIEDMGKTIWNKPKKTKLP